MVTARKPRSNVDAAGRRGASARPAPAAPAAALAKKVDKIIKRRAPALRQLD
jgi:hypothetical protein